MSTIPPFALPVIIVVSIKFGINLFAANLVLLHSFDALKLRSKIIDEPDLQIQAMRRHTRWFQRIQKFNWIVDCIIFIQRDINRFV
jgi:hypothetical protein